MAARERAAVTPCVKLSSRVAGLRSDQVRSGLAFGFGKGIELRAPRVHSVAIILHNQPISSPISGEVVFGIPMQSLDGLVHSCLQYVMRYH